MYKYVKDNFLFVQRFRSDVVFITAHRFKGMLLGPTVSMTLYFNLNLFMVVWFVL